MDMVEFVAHTNNASFNSRKVLFDQIGFTFLLEVHKAAMCYVIQALAESCAPKAASPPAVVK